MIELRGWTLNEFLAVSRNGGMTAASPRPDGDPSGSSAALFDSLPDAVLVIDGDGVITQVNAAAERLFGYSRLRLVGEDHRMLLAEGYRSGFDRLFASLRTESGD